MTPGQFDWGLSGSVILPLGASSTCPLQVSLDITNNPEKWGANLTLLRDTVLEWGANLTLLRDAVLEERHQRRNWQTYSKANDQQFHLDGQE